MRCQIRYWIRSQTRLSVIVEPPFFSVASIRGLVGNFIVEEFLSLAISYPFSGNFPRFTKNDCSFRQPQINITILASVQLFLLATASPLWSGQKKCISVDIYPSQFPAWKCHWLRSTLFNIWIISCWLNWIHKVPIWIFNGVEQQNICQPEDVFGSLHFIPRAFNRPCDPSYLTSKRWHIKDGCALKPDQGTDEFEVRDILVFIDLNDIKQAPLFLPHAQRTMHILDKAWANMLKIKPAVFSWRTFLHPDYKPKVVLLHVHSHQSNDHITSQNSVF